MYPMYSKALKKVQGGKFRESGREHGLKTAGSIIT
jgi:hypothetical protein